MQLSVELSITVFDVEIYIGLYFLISIWQVLRSGGEFDLTTASCVVGLV